MHGLEFFLRSCDCIQVSYRSAGYFPSQGAIYEPKFGIRPPYIEAFTFFNTVEQNDAFLELINYTDWSEGSFLIGDGMCDNLRIYSEVPMEERLWHIEPPDLDSDE